MKLERGIIVGLHGSWGSGIGTLLVRKEGEKEPKGILCENGPTVRALDACFGGVIGAGHTINQKGGHIGKEIFYSLDIMDMLESFVPVEALSEEEIAEIEKEGEEG